MRSKLAASSRQLWFDFGQMGPSYSPSPPHLEAEEESRGPAHPFDAEQLPSNSNSQLAQFPITGGNSGNGTRSINNSG